VTDERLPVRHEPFGNKLLVKLVKHLPQKHLVRAFAWVTALWLGSMVLLGSFNDPYEIPGKTFPVTMYECSNSGKVYTEQERYELCQSEARVLYSGEKSSAISAPDYSTRLGHNMMAFAGWLATPVAALALLGASRQVLPVVAKKRARNADLHYATEVEAMTRTVRMRLYVITNIRSKSKNFVEVSGFRLDDPNDHFSNLSLHKANVRWGHCLSPQMAGWFTSASYGPKGLMRGPTFLLSAPVNELGLKEAGFDETGTPKNYAQIFRKM